MPQDQVERVARPAAGEERALERRRAIPPCALRPWVNMKDPVRGREAGAAAPAGADLRLRPAGRDRRGQRRRGLAPTGLVPPGVPGSQQVTGPYAYDAAKAAELVEEAGSPTLELAYPTPCMRILAESLPAGYAKIGISIRPRGMSKTPSGALTGRQDPAVPAGLGRRLPVDGQLPLPDVPQRLARANSDRPTRIPRSTPCWTRRAPRSTRRLAMQLYAEAERLILADAPAHSSVRPHRRAGS